MSRFLKIVFTLMLALLAANSFAQQKPAPRPARTNAAPDVLQQWVADNFDTNALDFLDGIDQDQVVQFFTKLTVQFDATNIFDLSQLKPLAKQVLPVLDYYEETQPYAIWLRAHLDDFDAAGDMQREWKTNAPKGNITVTALPPTPKFEREFWNRRVSKAPWPPLAKTYVPRLKPIFTAERVPPELVWVAAVESSFDPRARSPVGAAGMFQLMPATAKTEHLSLWPFDQRYQPEKCAHAAAQYLRVLHKHYGDWRLALAAYNVGEGRIDKLLKEHRAKTFDAISRWLPAETQMYVPKIEATIRLREGLALADLRSPAL